MKKPPTPRVAAPLALEFVMARVFDVYRELATPERTRQAKRRDPLRAPSRRVGGEAR